MQLIDLLVTGLSLGAVYSLVAIGFVIVYKASGTLNFAHGAVLVFGAYLVARLWEPLGFWPAAIIGVAGAALLAVVIERALIRPIKDAPHMSLAILTIGVEILINTAMIQQIGPDVLPLGHPWGNATFLLGTTVIPVNRVLMIAVAVVIIAAFLLVIRFTTWGIAMRASAEDQETAELMGLRLSRITIVAWLIAGALAGIAGIFLTGAPTPGLTATLALIAMRAFTAAIIGGLDSFVGALVGGMLVGLSEAVAIVFQDDLAFLGRGIGAVLPYVVMIVVLVIKPQGLFGSKEMARA